MNRFFGYIAGMAETVTPFDRVVEKIGSQARLGELLGKRQSTVSYWAKSGIPAEDAVELERVTNGDVPRWLSRPDLWDAPPFTEATQ
jgi:DNA-binding transcriptional regulator YdaS (Cro superfamily)